MTETFLTDRLILRPRREEDRAPFAALNADPEVMEHDPATLDRAASDAMVERITVYVDTTGVGRWSLERRSTGEFIGYTGLNPMPDWSP